MSNKRPYRAFKVRCAGCVVHRSVDGVIEVVVARRSDGQWSFPRGKIVPGERPRDTAAREAAEEVGLDVTVAVELGGYAYPIGRARFKHVEFFAATPRGGVLAPDGREFVEALWLPLDEARTKLAPRDAVLLDTLSALHTAAALH
jgi:8-oxo-dGTP diphosphatase